MNWRFFDHRRARQVLTLLFISGALGCMFPPRQQAFLWWAAHAEQVALAYLLLGLLFFMSNRYRLMLVCLGCSAAISLYYYESNQAMLSHVL